MTLRARVSRGLFWEGGAALVGQGLSFLVSLLLARLLTPEYFGLLAIANLAIQSLVFFQELGFSSALIYRQKDVEAAANTAHWTIVTSSALLYLVAFLAAPLVAKFFHSPETMAVLRVLALTMVINSFSRVPYTLLTKELDFRKKVLPELTASLIGNLAALLLAWLGWRVWALVAGELLSALLVTLLVYLVSSWRPRFQFVRSIFRDLFGYGKHIAVSQVLIFGITNIDDMFVGRMLGQAALGQYGLAYKISNTPATNITRVVNRVTFPAYSLLQANQERLRSAFFRQVRFVGALAMPIGVATVVFAHDFVYAVLNESWAPAIAPMQLLAIYGVIRSVAANMGVIFQAGGKPQWLTGIATWRLVTMALLLYPFISRGGLVGVSLLSAGVAAVDFVIAAFLVDKILDARMITYARILGPMLVYALLAGGLGYLVNAGLLALGVWDVAALLAGGAVLVLVYGLLTWRRDDELRPEISRALVSLRRRVRPT
ncbi:MAG TPA: lipopolysaccharide biosynthesis protein [Anaerolineae bacterium]|nr:lipopolysaccharide biosynthesis protein [Anaerolineae bacterium]HNU05118.1 lipopolysaccharide biosynthesis protein [Anaerolineae bacterium]